MSQSPAKKRLQWFETGVLAVLGGLLVFGLAANGLSLLQSVVGLGFGAGVLLIAWLWQLTLRRAESAPPPTWRQTAWDAAVFVACLAVVGPLVWRFASNRSDRTRQEGSPAASFPNASEETPEDDAPPERSS